MNKTYKAKHTHWEDIITFIDNNTFKRNNGDGGSYTFENNILTLKWDNWDSEVLNFVDSETFSRSDPLFTLTLIIVNVEKSEKIISQQNSEKSTIYIQPQGRFGNLVFKYIAAYTLAKKYNLNVAFLNESDCNSPPSIYETFKHMIQPRIPNCITIQEKNFTYESLPQLDSNKNYLMVGYYQSHRYSNNEILTEIRNNLKINSKAEKIVTQTSKYKVALHLRRGDYLTTSFTVVQSDEYYSSCLKYIVDDTSKYTIFVFSDDIPYAKTWNVLNGYDCVFVDENVEDSFWAMSLCDNFIISSSSFSLTACMLREKEDARICFPRKWFTSSGPEYKISDLINLNNNVTVAVMPRDIYLSYVINLKRRPDRLKSFRESVTLETTRWDAVDGKEYKKWYNTDEDFKKRIDCLEIATKNPYEIGCSYSHWLLWKHIANDNTLSDDFPVVVFEDDVILCKDFYTDFNTLINHLKGDVIYIGGRNRENWVPSSFNDWESLSNGLYVRKTDKWGYDYDRCTSAYIITKKAAKLFVENSLDLFSVAIDHWMFIKYKELNMTVIDRFPHITYSIFDKDTDIQGKQRVDLKIKHP